MLWMVDLASSYRPPPTDRILPSLWVGSLNDPFKVTTVCVCVLCILPTRSQFRLLFWYSVGITSCSWWWRLLLCFFMNPSYTFCFLVAFLFSHYHRVNCLSPPPPLFCTCFSWLVYKDSIIKCLYFSLRTEVKLIYFLFSLEKEFDGRLFIWVVQFNRNTLFFVFRISCVPPAERLADMLVFVRPSFGRKLKKNKIK